MLQGDLARLLVGERAARPRAAEGEAPTAATTDDARLRLVGVLSPPGGVSNDPREPGGLALIAIDGQPPRVFAVGDAVDGQRVLLRVAQRRADIGFAGQPPQLSLVIPEPSAAVPGAARMGINTPSGAHQSAAVAAGASAAR